MNKDKVKKIGDGEGGKENSPCDLVLQHPLAMERLVLRRERVSASLNQQATGTE